MKLHATYLSALLHILGDLNALDTPFACEDYGVASPSYTDRCNYLIEGDSDHNELFAEHVNSGGSESLTAVMLPGDDSIKAYIWAWYDENGITHVWSKVC